MAQLGQTVRDAVTGFTGIAASRIELLNGNVQFSVYPKAKEDAEKYPEGVSVDCNLCEVVDDGLMSKVVTPSPDLPRFELGQRVRDKLNGFVGVAIRRSTFISGCIYYVVEGKAAAASTKHYEEEFFPAQRLELVEETKPMDLTQLRTRTGGPSEPVHRQR